MYPDLGIPRELVYSLSLSSAKTRCGEVFFFSLTTTKIKN